MLEFIRFGDRKVKITQIGNDHIYNDVHHIGIVLGLNCDTLRGIIDS